MANLDHFLRALRGLRGAVGDGAIEQLATTLDGQSTEADQKWQRHVLKVMADAVREYGAEGIDTALRELEKAVGGSDADFSFTTLRAGSELLAELQVAEAEKRERIRKFIQAAFQIIKQAIKAIL